MTNLVKETLTMMEITLKEMDSLIANNIFMPTIDFVVDVSNMFHHLRENSKLLLNQSKAEIYSLALVYEEITKVQETISQNFSLMMKIAEQTKKNDELMAIEILVIDENKAFMADCFRVIEYILPELINFSKQLIALSKQN